MKNSIRFLSLFLSLLSLIPFSFSQQRNCYTMEYLEQQIQNDPGLVERMEQIERFTQSYVQQYPDGGTRAVVTIPVVVHVVYRTSTENISDAQIQSQIDVLNADFRRLNSDADNVWSQAADAEIEFCLATVDPCGNSTDGITRTVTTVSGFGKSNSLKSDDLGGKDAWPADEYMNLWVCNIGGGTLGYATPPGFPAALDGVVIDYRYMGTSGTATAPYDLGRTGTHEVGHYLNLVHIWGDSICGFDDHISDTPESDAPNYGCAIGHVSCMTTDMVQNYMDYSDDACMNLFTSGQKTRMKALFGTGGSRVGLLTSNGCGTPNDSVDVAFVIDNTGSMAEEIAGVRNALLSTLSTYDAGSCGTVFQLTTFKDGFTINDTTTDLSIIQAQVSALTASGGGDCPEASVEAINAVQAKVKDNGTVFVATDASPHAGLDIEAAKNALTARGIRVSTILSGDCSSVPTVAGTAGGSSSSIPDPDMAQVPYSDNQNPSGTSSSPAAAGVPNSFSAIETFSYLAKETGGTFAFIPEVNGGTTAEKLRYENTAFNIIQGGITQSVAFSEPKEGPQGGTLAVTFTGANTHFDPTTTLAFSGGDITVLDLQIVSPMKLAATLAIGSGASLGFRDVTATTTLSGGLVETAEGVGAFGITAGLVGPQILSISPPDGIQGEILSVKVFGSNTNFDPSSVLSLGSGITVLSSTSTSLGVLEADIQIDPSAIVGFRSIQVVTGSETATENVIGPFFVSLATASPCDLDVTITQEDLPEFCQGGVVLIANSPTATSYLWSNGATTPEIEVMTSGDYIVTIGDAGGCTASDTISVTYDPQDMISAYTILGERGVELNNNNTVLNGGIGVLKNKKKAEFSINTDVTAATTFVKSPKIETSSGSTVSSYIKGIPDVVVPPFLSINPVNTEKLIVQEGTTVTLTGRLYEKIELESFATLIFTEADVYIESLIAEDDATVKFAQCTHLRVEEELELNKRVDFNPDNRSVTIYVDEGSAEINEGTLFRASLYVPNESITAKGKSSSPTLMKGFFYGKKVYGDKYVNWDWNAGDCDSCTPSTDIPPAPCPCEDGLVVFAVEYQGADGVDVNVYLDDSHSDLIGSFTNVQSGDVLIVDADAMGEDDLGQNLYYEVVGSSGPDTRIDVSCSQVLENVVHGNFATHGYIDVEENACNLLVSTLNRNNQSASDTQLADLSLQVAPNPFTKETKLSFELEITTHVELAIYDLSGRLVKTLYKGQANAEEVYMFTFDGTNQAKGIYIARFVANGKIVHKKLILTD